MNTRWLRYTIPILLGGMGGYLYYYFIGCLGDTCPLTSNPWLSTLYGALIGWLAAPKTTKQTHTAVKEKETP